MANLPSKHPNLAIHLVDRTLTPLITSSHTQLQSQSLASISQVALLTYETAQRLGLGSPQRIMIEHASNGPILLHSFLDPSTGKLTRSQYNSNSTLNPLVDIGSLDLRDTSETGTNQRHSAQLSGESDGPEDDADAPPLLLGTVITRSPETVLEARRAAARLERIAKEVQAKWV